MFDTPGILIGSGESPIVLEPRYANRHGLIAGATGTGHPIRTTISEMGPLLLARLLELSEAQEVVLNIVSKHAD